jgi:hypothetical protein
LAVAATSTSGACKGIYLLLGTSSGAEPGIGIDSLLLPLNVDAYTTFSLQSPNSPPFTKSLGVLDERGQARAKIAFPSGLTGLPAGLVLEHAFVVLDATGVQMVSNPLPLAFVP